MHEPKEKPIDVNALRLDCLKLVPVDATNPDAAIKTADAMVKFVLNGTVPNNTPAA